MITECNRPSTGVGVNPIRITLVDSQEITRRGLQLLLESHPNFRVSEEGQEVSERGNNNKIPSQVSVVNVHMSEGAGVLRELELLAERTNVILLTDRKELDAHFRSFIQAIAKGVKGIVLRDESVASLVEAITEVHACGTWFAEAALGRMLGKILDGEKIRRTDSVAARTAKLTQMEREVIALVSQGMKNRQVAAQLSLSEPKVRHRLTAIFEKLGVSDRLELAIYAHQHNLHRP